MPGIYQMYTWYAGKYFFLLLHFPVTWNYFPVQLVGALYLKKKKGVVTDPNVHTI